MSLVLIEGWDSLSDVADFYTELGSPTLDQTIKKTGSQSLSCNSYNNGVSIPLPAADTYIIGFYIRVSALGGGSSLSHQLNFCRNSAGNVGASINDTGTITFYRYTTPLGVCSKLLTNQAWHFLEIKATCKNSIAADEFIVKIDNEVVLNLAAGTNTQASATSGIDEIRLVGGYISGVINYDNLYVCNLSGSVNNNFLGPVNVETLYPNGNGNSNDFDGSDGNQVDNYLLVDEAQQNADTDYTESNTVSDLDLYTFDDMSATPEGIKGLSTRSYMKKTDAGSRTGKLQCRRSAVNYEGDEFFPSESYKGVDYLLEQDPSTASAWTEAGVNAAEFGIKVHS